MQKTTPVKGLMTPLSTVLSKKVSHGKLQASAVVMRNRTQCHLRVRVCIISPSCHFQHDYDNNARQWANFVDKIQAYTNIERMWVKK